MLKKAIHTTSLKASIIANYAGNIWSSLIALIFVPFYLKYIGAEGYGLIGIFAALQMALSLLDSGLSTTLSKELARLNVLKNSDLQIRNLVKTLETIYWGIAIIAGLIAVGISPLLSAYWIQPKELNITTINFAFILLSISLIFQFPIGFYSGGLLGLQKQVMLNVIRISFSTLKSIGALIVLIFISKTVIAFFTWNLFISIIQAFVIRFAVWHSLPRTGQAAVFDKNELKNVWRFVLGITGTSLTAILLTQIDKIVLSKVLSLEEFGYYSVGYTIGMMIYQITNPVTQSYFPKLSGLISIGNAIDLKKLYHQGCQVISVLVLPATFILMFYSYDLIWIWTQDKITTDNTWLITAFIAFGTGINGLINLPNILAIAYGWTKLGFYQNIALLCFMTPLTIFLALNYGALGGALSWTIMNILYFMVTPSLIHKKILKGELKYWYFNDTLFPLIACFLVVFFSKLIINLDENSRWLNLCIILSITIISVIAGILASTDLKKYLVTIKSSLRLKQS